MSRAQAALIAALAVLALPASAAAARPATPDLIQSAQATGEISGTRATQLRAYALADPHKLPGKYRSQTPWDGTLTLLRIHRALPKLKDSSAKRETAALAGPSASAVTSCDSSSADLPNSVDTSHFHIDYDTLGAGLTITQYGNSLETTWGQEVTNYGWAAPPIKSGTPNGHYAVRIDTLDNGLYGFVSDSGTYAGLIGNNPNTSWNDGDAYATCMVLNRDYSGFPSNPQNSLDSTTAHEFNHSLQYGYGGLTGTNAASESFTEAGATWMEDEVYDSSNDNYNYLWPDFRQGLANYDSTFPYPDWIALRGITEPYGTNTAGGGEDVMQQFWELASQGTAGNLTAMEQAVAAKGGTLPTAYQNYAIAVKFSKSCGGGNGTAPPDCFEEGNAYAANVGAKPASDTSISAVGGSASDTVTDGYAVQWTSLPTTGGPYSVRVKNLGTGGTLRSTVACNPGTGSPLTLLQAGTLTAGQTKTVKSFNPAGCSSPVVVTTNSAHSTSNPTNPTARSMQVQALGLRTLDVTKAGAGSGTVTSSPSGIDCGSDCTDQYTDGDTVTLTEAPTAGSNFSGWSGACTGTGTTCTVTMSQARSVTASFQPQAPPGQQALIVGKSGASAAGGHVMSTPGGIDCDPTCSADYADGTSVALSASAPAGSSFSGWSGDCSGTAACTVTMDQTRSVSATFQPDQTLTVSKAGSGNVASTPAGISCGTTCHASYHYGQSVTLSAAAASGYSFSGWSGACSGTGPCTVTMSAARSVTARFIAVGAGGLQQTSTPGGTPAPALDLPPSLTTPRLSHSRFRASPASGKRPAVGARVRYRLSESARLRFKVQRRRGGHWRSAGSFTRRGKAGSNSFVFKGRMHGHKLKPGLYRFVVYARSADGARSVVHRKTFRILSP